MLSCCKAAAYRTKESESWPAAARERTAGARQRTTERATERAARQPVGEVAVGEVRAATERARQLVAGTRPATTLR